MKYLFLVSLLLLSCSEKKLTDLNTSNSCIELPNSTDIGKAKLLFQYWSYAATWENKKDVQLQMQIFDNGRIERNSECGWLVGYWSKEEQQKWIQNLPTVDFEFFGDKKALFYPKQKFHGMVLHTPSWDAEYFLSDSIPASTYTERFQKMWQNTLSPLYLAPILWKHTQAQATTTLKSLPY